MAMREELTPLVDKATAPASTSSWTSRRKALSDRKGLTALLVAVALGLAVVIGFEVHSTVAPSSESLPADASYLCDPETKQDAGYVKLANKEDDHYFYWYSESRRSPETDPLVLWLTGGPGGSSIMAMLAENGPCKILPGVATEVNPYSWTTQANVVWLDQPTSVGFSHGAPQDKDFNEADVGENIYWFLQGFLAKHPELQGREFFVTGESYGGHYVPATAHYIWNLQRHNESTAPHTQHINLQGLAVGNGLTNPLIQYLYNADMANNAYNISLLTPAQTQQMRTDAVECVELTRQCQEVQAGDDDSVCSEAQGCWQEKLIAPFTGAGRNRYDIRQPCHPDYPLCYNFTDIHTYLDSPSVREMLHVDSQVGPWLEINGVVSETFVQDGDWSRSFHTYVADMLDDGLRVLIYAGDADIMCNWQGNRAWTLALDWSGKDGFNAAPERAFVTHDPLVESAPAVDAGVLRTYENFVFVRLFNAGHMVPMDQPAVALELLNKFLDGETF